LIKADFNPIRKSSLTLVQTGCRQHPIPHVAVGREALSENAERLITHPTRPLEPVSV